MRCLTRKTEPGNPLVSCLTVAASVVWFLAGRVIIKTLLVRPAPPGCPLGCLGGALFVLCLSIASRPFQGYLEKRAPAKPGFKAPALLATLVEITPGSC